MALPFNRGGADFFTLDIHTALFYTEIEPRRAFLIRKTSDCMAFQAKIADYFKDSYAEMKKVVWPSRRQTLQHTGIVILFSLVVALFLGALDIFFQWGIENILSR